MDVEPDTRRLEACIPYVLNELLNNIRYIRENVVNHCIGNCSFITKMNGGTDSFKEEILGALELRGRTENIKKVKGMAKVPEIWECYTD